MISWLREWIWPWLTYALMGFGLLLLMLLAVMVSDRFTPSGRRHRRWVKWLDLCKERDAAWQQWQDGTGSQNAYQYLAERCATAGEEFDDSSGDLLQQHEVQSSWHAGLPVLFIGGIAIALIWPELGNRSWPTSSLLWIMIFMLAYGMYQNYRYAVVLARHIDRLEMQLQQLLKQTRS